MGRYYKWAIWSMCAESLVKKSEGKRTLGVPDFDGRILLKWRFGLDV